MSVLNKKINTSVMDYEYYKNTGLYDESQLRQIECGFNDGLTSAEVAMFANPESPSLAMFLISYKLCFENENGIEHKFNPNLSSKQLQFLNDAMVYDYISGWELYTLIDGDLDMDTLERLRNKYIKGY